MRVLEVGYANSIFFLLHYRQPHDIVQVLGNITFILGASFK